MKLRIFQNEWARKVLRLLIVKRINRMDQQERKQFWEVLCSLQGNDLQSESEKLAKTIILPRYLYRYGDCSAIEFVDQLLEIYTSFEEQGHPMHMFSFTDHNQINVDVYKEFRKKSNMQNALLLQTMMINNSSILMVPWNMIIYWIVLLLYLTVEKMLLERE